MTGEERSEVRGQRSESRGRRDAHAVRGGYPHQLNVHRGKPIQGYFADAFDSWPPTFSLKTLT